METTIPSILLIDDDVISRLLIAEVLESANVIILECGSGCEALRHFEKFQNEIKLLLVDIKLPDYDGWGLLGKLRELKPDIQAIAISALFPEDFFYRSRAAGFNAYLSKPLDLVKFRTLVESFLII